MLKKALLILAGLAITQYSFAADAPVAASATPAVAAVVDGNVFLTDKAGKHALDQMCGMQVVVGEKTPKADYDGKRYYFCSDGCGKAFSAKPAEGLAKLALPAYVTAISGGKLIVNCAVSAEKMTVDDKTPHQVYKGNDYFFCCNKCPKAFAKNPDKYALKSGSTGTAGAEGHTGH